MEKPRSVKINCRLGGGLGNQLFRYAAARALALELQAETIFEIGGFLRDSFGREYLLDNFTGPREFRKTRLRDSIFGRLRLRLRNRWQHCLREQDFMERVPSISDVGSSRSVTLEGYWQSEMYFRKHRQALLEELQFALQLNEANKVWADQIDESAEPVAIHFRSYKEVSGEMSGKIMGEAYYAAACRGIKERLPEAEFYMFTDDLAMAEQSLPKEMDYRYIDANKGGGELGGLMDMFLMSRCRHFVTANSSFSWWGAWLSQNVHGFFETTENSRIAYYPSEKLSHPEMVPDFGKTLSLHV